MKRNLLAIAIPALLVAGTANAAVEVFNKDGNTVSVNGQVAAKYKKTDESSARLGFNATTTISDELKAFARFELDANAPKKKNSEDKLVDQFISHRYGFVGLDFGTYGKVSYGKNTGVLSNVTDFTDVLPEFGGDAPVILKSRSNGVVTYNSNGFYGLVDGLDLVAQYATNDDKAGTIGLSATYDVLDTGVKVGAAYAQGLGEKSKDQSISYALAASYEGYGAYAAVLFSHDIGYKYGVNKDAKARAQKMGVEVVAKYTESFDFGSVTPSVAYIHNFAKAATPKDADETKFETVKAEQYVQLGVDYGFNSNISSFVSYKVAFDKDQKNELAVGVTYKF